MDCSICLDALDSGVVALPCGHRFHAACLAQMAGAIWGVSWCRKGRRWQAQYRDADDKTRYIGHFDTQEQAAHAVNAAIRRAGLEGRRRTNPVVDGRLVPKKRKANGHGPPRKSRKQAHR